MSGKVYKSIIDKLTDERVSKEIDSIYKTKIPEDIREWVDEYETYGEREEFIWKWLYKINRIWMHSRIDNRFHEKLVKAKFLYNMFIVLLDDVAEEKGKKRLLDSLVEIPRKNGKTGGISLSKKDSDYYHFSKKVWSEIIKILKGFSHWSDLKDFFYFDTNQFLNAVYYSNLVLKKPQLINEKEFWLYIPHSMQILIDLDMDLMCSPKLIPEELGQAREAVLTLQEMGRIGNWLSTWEREVKVGDYTSIVVAYALKNNLIDQKKLENSDRLELIEIVKRSDAEKWVLENWEERYKRLGKLTNGTKLVSRKKILKNARYLIFMHLSSRGHK